MKKIIGYDENNEAMYALSFKEIAYIISTTLLSLVVYVALVCGTAYAIWRMFGGA